MTTSSRPSGDTPTVIGPDGTPVALDEDGGAAAAAGDAATSLAAMVPRPDKVMRIGTMIKQLLDEVKAAPLDEASRARLRDIQQRSVVELCDGLAPELRAELERITLPFSEEGTPSDSELRVAQAQLVGWLEGLFHGIQTALFAQQMAARTQLEQMRGRALPGGAPGGGERPGQYL